MRAALSRRYIPLYIVEAALAEIGFDMSRCLSEV